MKANYTKPLLAVEMFSATQSVARDCTDNLPGGYITTNDIHNCAWSVSGTTVFISKPNCQINGEHMDSICYNNPAEGYYIFRS